MIISASRRTDIPAFFGQWFMHRIKEGSFLRVNPFNPRQVRVFSLRPQDVDVIIFWTKNARPFFSHLPSLDAAGFCYYFHFTLNDYPHWLEPGLPPLTERVETFLQLSQAIGCDKLIWRYDPIILSSQTPVDHHLDQLWRLGKQLQGYTGRLVVSCLDYYGKVTPRLQQMGKQRGIEFFDLAQREEDRGVLGLALRQLAAEFNLQMSTCAEMWRDQKGTPLLASGSCIDAQLIEKLFGFTAKVSKDPGQRLACRCLPSVDVGAYNTCLHQCLYCYANHSPKSISSNLQRHDTTGPSLLQPAGVHAVGEQSPAICPPAPSRPGK